MPSYLPTYEENTLSVLIATVGSGAMSVGSAHLGPVGFVPLPGRGSADYFSVADVGRIVMVLGAGPSGGNLVTKIDAYIDTQNVTLHDAASTTVIDSNANTFVYRPIKVLEGSISDEDTLTGHSQSKFTQLLLDGVFPPVEGQPFLMTSTDPNVGIGTYGSFRGGEISTVTTSNYTGSPNGNDNRAECDCVSFEIVPVRRAIQGRQLHSRTMKQIAQAIIDEMTDEFFTVSSPDGPTLDLFTIDDLSYADKALNSLMDQSAGSDKYFWKVDQWRTLKIAIQAATPAPFSIDETTGTDGNVFAQLTNSTTLDRFGNQFYMKADKCLGDELTETIVNSFLGTAIPSYRVSITLKNNAGAVPTITINGVTKGVWTCGTDPRSDSTAFSIPSGFGPTDWAWPIDSNYLFIPSGVPTGPGGIPPGGTAVVKYHVATPASSLYTYAASINARAAIQGGSGIADVIVQLSNPMTRTELDAKSEAAAKSFGIPSQSLSIVTVRSGLRSGQGIPVNLPSINAVGTFLVESVNLDTKSGWPVWTAKATIGALVGDYKTAFSDALGLGSISGGGVNGNGVAVPLTLDFNPASGWVGVDYTAALVAKGGVLPYAFSTHDGSLPTGLSLNTTTGIISGTPTVAGTYTFNARVTDAALVVQDIAVSLVIAEVTPSPYPDAENITFSNLTPYYDTIGTEPVFGVEGLLTMPVSYAHIKFVHVTITIPKDSGDAIEEVCAPLQPALGLAFLSVRGDTKFPYDITTDQDYTITVSVENEDGKLTSPPYTTILHVTKPTITSFASSDSSQVRWRDKGGALHLTLPTTVSCSRYPQFISFWVNSPQYGRHFQGIYDVPAGATVFNLGAEDMVHSILYPPTAADESVAVYAALGAYSEDDNPTTIVGVRVVSVLVHAPPVPLSSAATHAYITNALPTYAKVGAGGSSLFGFDGPINAPLSDPNFVAITMCLQTGTYISGVWTPGGQRPNTPDPNDSKTRVADYGAPTPLRPDKIEHGDIWSTVDLAAGLLHFTVAPTWDVPTDGFPYFHVHFFVANTKLDSQGRFIWTEQHCCQQTAGVSTAGTDTFIELLVDSSKAAISVGRGIKNTTDGGSEVVSDSLLSDIPNPGFEDGLKDWTPTDPANVVAPGNSYTGLNGAIIVTNIGFGSGLYSAEEAVRPTDPVYLEAWIKAQGMVAGEPPLAVWLAFYDNTQSFLGDGGSLGPSADPAIVGWAAVKTSAIAPANSSYVRAILEYRSATHGSGVYVVDNVVLKAQQKTSGPLYTDIADNLALRISNDYVLTSGVGGLTLTQNIIDLAKAVSYDLTNFQLVGSTFKVKSIAVDSLIAGNALFAGDVTLARSGGGKVTINSAGIAIADNNSFPSTTLTISSSGMTAQRGLNNVQVTNTGVYIIFGGGFAGQWDASGILLQKGSNQIQIDAGAVNITQGKLILDTNGVTTSINNNTDLASALPSGITVKSNSTSLYTAVTSNGVYLVDGFGSGYGQFFRTSTGGVLRLFDTTGRSIQLIPNIGGIAIVAINGVQVVTNRQTGPGDTTDITDVAARFNSLLTALRTHGLIT